MSIWNKTTRKAVTSSRAASLKEIGDRVSGTLAKGELRTTRTGESVMVLEFTEDDSKALWLSTVGLKDGALQLEPEIGDHLSIELVGHRGLEGGRAMNLYRFDVRRADGSTSVLDQRDEQSATSSTDSSEGDESPL